MNKTLIFRKIGGIISEITEQYQYLASDPENINPLELELFIANSHFLSEHLAILKKLDGNMDSVNVSHSDKQFQQKEVAMRSDILSPEKMDYAPASAAPEPAAADAQENLFNTAEPEALFKEIETVENIPQYEPTESAAITAENVQLPVHAKSEIADSSVESVEESMPVNNNIKDHDNFKPATDERVPTLNEILSAGKKTETIISNINQLEDKDLKTMIKLNDKLMFVRDLFNGYSLAYSEAIEFINRFDNFESADNFLKHNYSGKNKWSEKQNSVDQFYEVLHKRFS